MRRKALAFLGSAAVVAAAAVGIWFLLRGQLLERRLQQVREGVEQNPDLHLRFSGQRWSGFRTFTLEEVELTSDSLGTLIKIKNLEVSVSLPGLLGLGRDFNSVKVAALTVNPDYWKLKNSRRSGNPVKTYPLHALVQKFSNWRNRTHSLEIAHAEIGYESNRLPGLNNIQFSLANDLLVATLQFYPASSRSFSIAAEGWLSGDSLQIKIKDNPGDSSHDITAYPDGSKSLTLAARNVDMNVSGSWTKENERFCLKGRFNTPQISWSKLSDSLLVFDNTEVDLRMISDASGIAVEAGSEIQTAEAQVFVHGRMDSVLAGSIQIPQQSIANFANALPSGEFQAIRSARPRGTFALEFSFHWIRGKPETLKMNWELESDSVLLGHPELLSQFAGDFIYYPAVDEMPRNIRRSGSPLAEQLPPVLVQSVILSEDPGFYEHNGINAAFLQKAAIENLRKGKFVRGAGTIPMQALRNLLLNNRKTLCRKMEEMALVWLNHKTKILSRERILEIYLSIAHWGPHVYGIREAARFYFGKSPAQLTADECIFLAMLLPRPNEYKNQFDETGNLKPHAQDYFDGMKLQLFDLDLIPEEMLEKQPAIRPLPLKEGHSASAKE